jgi:GT2 family glycosyltransferase
MKQLSIIIVSWNVKDLLRKCLNSIDANKGDIDLEVFVVDNASHDGSAEMVVQEFSGVNLIASKENLGFAKGNNLAIKQTTGEYVLLLNPDTEIFSDTLAKSLEFMRQHVDCGIMGCKMVYPDGSDQASVRLFPTWWPIFLMLVKAPKLFPKLESIKKYLAENFDYSKTQTVDQVMGAYMMIPKSALDKVGLLDERFFNWFEEVDLCKRFWQAGYKVYYFAETKIIHHGGKSFSQQKLVTNQRVFFSSALKYFLKHGLK